MKSESRLLIEGILSAYRQGAFPMADPESGQIRFFIAPMRGVFPIAPNDPLGEFHVPRSLRRRINSGWFDIRCDTAFTEVIRGCAAPRVDDPETWINHEIMHWFETLFDAGLAHTIEAWRRNPRTGRDVLVGGIYGIALGGAFFGESMFSKPAPRLANGRRRPLDGTDASKVCLVKLVEHLKRRGYVLFDTQLVNPHLRRFGCVELPHERYMERLAAAIDLPVTWGVYE